MSLQSKLTDIALGELGNGPDKYRSWYYGCEMYGTAWCAVFVSWCANECGILNTLVPKEDGAGSFAREGVPNNMGKWLEAKRYVEPMVGDIITYRDGGEYNDQYHADHVGIIVGVSESGDGTWDITAVEGNTGGDNDSSCVNKRYYNSKNGYVYAYYRPNYDNGEDDYMECKKGDINVFVLAVKSLLRQARALGIIEAGCDDTMGFGDGTEKAVLELQALAGLTEDGIAGVNTITALRNAIDKKIAAGNSAIDKNTTLGEIAKMAGL